MIFIGFSIFYGFLRSDITRSAMRVKTVQKQIGRSLPLGGHLSKGGCRCGYRYWEWWREGGRMHANKNVLKVVCGAQNAKDGLITIYGACIKWLWGGGVTKRRVGSARLIATS